MTREIPVLTEDKMEDFHFGGGERPSSYSLSSHLFHINRLEDYIDKLTFPLPPHRKLTYDFIFIVKGNSTRSKGLNEFNIKPNQFFFLPPHQITEHSAMSKDVEGFYVHFSSNLFQEAGLAKILERFEFLTFLAEPIIEIDNTVKERVVYHLNALLMHYQDYDQKNNLKIVSYVLAILAEADSFYLQKEKIINTASSYLVQLYKDALSHKIYEFQKVTEYADYLNVSPNHLNKCVKQTTNKTAQELLNEMLILEAKSLLKYSKLQVAEVAVRLCNQNPSNFSRFFKSQTGVRPKAYQSL